MTFQREKLTAPVLRLEISDNIVTPLSTSPVDEPSPTFRQRARALSQAALPSLRPSQGIASSVPSPLLPSAPVPGTTKARDESQKLLAHVLGQLRHRPKCPSSNFLQSHAMPAAKSTVPRPNTSRTSSMGAQSADTDSEDRSERVFSPDSAFDLMSRLRDVLMISLSQGWQLFNERRVFQRTSLV
jgi:hypothetical protein